MFFTLEGKDGVSDTYTVDNLMVATPRQELIESRAFERTLPKHTLVESEKTVTLSGRSVQSMGDCENACDQEAAMLCESFAFCASAGKCILSPDTVAQSSSGVEESDSCDVFTRTYASLFIAVDGGLASSDSDVAKTTSSLEECARSCSLLTDFKCQSFAVCGSSDCILKTQHAFSSETTATKERHGDKECDLYTGKQVCKRTHH